MPGNHAEANTATGYCGNPFTADTNPPLLKAPDSTDAEKLRSHNQAVLG